MKPFMTAATAVVVTLIVFAARADTPRQTPTRLETPSGTIYGTLELPAGTAPFPVALLIAGSGPTDRNGNAPPVLNTDAYKLLAEALAKNGIATLRYDKRGIARSAAAAPTESELRFSTYVRDAAAWCAQLATDERFSSLFIIGHSEGSLIGMVAARKADIAGYISIAGAGEPAQILILSQLKPKLPPKLYHKAEAIIASLERGKMVTDVPAPLGVLFRASVQPYLISWFQYDPAKEIARLDVPALIVQGKRDIQVPVSAARKLAKADPSAKLALIPHMNHVLKDVGPSREDNLKSYRDPALPIDPTLVKSISRFIHHFSTDHGAQR